MTIKKRSYKEQENDKQKGKKRYRERLVETEEAENEIKQYDWREPIDLEKEEHPYNNDK